MLFLRQSPEGHLLIHHHFCPSYQSQSAKVRILNWVGFHRPNRGCQVTRQESTMMHLQKVPL
jgi:hypothetical protein